MSNYNYSKSPSLEKYYIANNRGYWLRRNGTVDYFPCFGKFNFCLADFDTLEQAKAAAAKLTKFNVIKFTIPVTFAADDAILERTGEGSFKTHSLKEFVVWTT